MIDGIAGIASQPQNQRTDSLGQEQFLKLMVTQFQNQDPFKPMDNGDFLGQLAQFGTVSGIQELQGSFAGLSDSLLSHQALQGAALIGRDALVDTDTVRFTGAPVAGAVDVPSAGGQMSVAIYDDTGSLVRRMEMGQVAPGMQAFAWDGRDATGSVVPAGTYRIESEFKLGGQAFALETLLYGRVNSVSLGRNGSGLTLNIETMGEMSLSRVRQIS